MAQKNGISCTLLQMNAPDFYLASTEMRGMEAPRRCWAVRRLTTDHNDDLLALRIDPPIIGQPYGLGDRDIDTVAVAVRLVGDSLFPIARWPVHVHVFRFLEAYSGQDVVKYGQLERIAWADLYATEADAASKRL
jgi:hypothetical protein